MPRQYRDSHFIRRPKRAEVHWTRNALLLGRPRQRAKRKGQRMAVSVQLKGSPYCINTNPLQYWLRREGDRRNGLQRRSGVQRNS